MGFYDGTKLLSMMDINGNKPEIYMCTSNRSAGKTTFFSRYFVNRYKKFGEKFMLLYRYKDELNGCADKFFKDIQTLFFPTDVMISKSCGNGLYHELYLNGDLCGFAVSINTAEKIKKYSHFFSDVQRLLFDEFQNESNKYCPQEIRKFISLHTSVARGGGKQVRYLPVFMLSNPVSIINPYYAELNISSRLQANTKFLRGDGFVLEQGFNESASIAQKESAFNKAFANNSYVAYSSECVYLNDSVTFIEKPSGNNIYLCTLRYNGNDYSVREYTNDGILYVDDSYDSTFRLRISVTTNDHTINYVMLKRNDFFLSVLRQYFQKGCFRFKNLKCKEVLLKAISFI